MRQIAAGIGLEHSDYRISYYTSQEQLAGKHVLEADGIYVRISPERFGEPGLAWRNPFWKPPGAVMRKAPITALADIPALSARIARELKIAPPAQPGLIHVVHAASVPNPNWLRPGVPGAGQQAFGDALLANHAFVAIPSVVSSHSWNLIFVATRAIGLYSLISQERFALDARLNPVKP